MWYVTYHADIYLKIYGAHGLPRRAFSLIESAIVLAVVGLVIGGIWVAAASVSENRKASQTLERLTTIVNNIRNSGVKPPTGDAFTFVDNGGICSGCFVRSAWPNFIPADMIGTNQTPTGPYGQPWNIQFDAEQIYFGLLFGDNVKACAALGPRIYGLMRDQLIPDPSGNRIYNGTTGHDAQTLDQSGPGCQEEYDGEGYATLSFIVKR